jgi:hypothetical protein
MPYDELITRPRIPTICKNDHETENQPYAPKWEQEERKKKKIQVGSSFDYTSNY